MDTKMKSLHKIFVQLFLITAGCAIILAQEVEHPSRSVEPILTEETLPNEVGEWDLRFSFDYFKNDEEINTTLPPIQLSSINPA